MKKYLIISFFEIVLLMTPIHFILRMKLKAFVRFLMRLKKMNTTAILLTLSTRTEPRIFLTFVKKRIIVILRVSLLLLPKFQMKKHLEIILYLTLVMM